MTSSTSKYNQSAKKEQSDFDTEFYKRQYQNAIKALELYEGEREVQQRDRMRQSLLELVTLQKQYQLLFKRRRFGRFSKICQGDQP